MTQSPPTPEKNPQQKVNTANGCGFPTHTVHAPGVLLGNELWIATGLGYSTQAVELQLSNALDAVGAQAPNARITYEMVGALPSTGAIRSG